MTDRETKADTVVRISTPESTIAEIRHSPERINDLFRKGEYPYKNKIRKAAYEKHKNEDAVNGPDPLIVGSIFAGD